MAAVGTRFEVAMKTFFCIQVFYFICKVFFFTPIVYTQVDGFSFGLIISSPLQSQHLLTAKIEQLRSQQSNFVNLSVFYIEDSVKAVQKICASPNLIGLLTVGDVQTVNEVSLLSQSLNLPHLALPYEPTNKIRDHGFTITRRPRQSDVIRAVTSVSLSLKMKRAVLFHDRKDKNHLKELFEAFHMERIKLATVQVTLDNGDAVLRHLGYSSQRRSKLFILDLKNDTMEVLFQQIHKMKMFRYDYFWIFIDPEFPPSNLMQRIPDDSNMAIVRTYEAQINCSVGLQRIYKNCDFTKSPSVEVDLMRTIDQLLNSVNSSMVVNSANFDCRAGSTSASGPDIMAALTPGLNSSRQIEVISMETKKNINGSSESHFVPSATWNAERGLLLSHGLRKQSVFQNLFTSWGKKILRICSPVLPLYFYYHNASGISVNKSMDEVGGLVSEIIRYLAKEIDFIPVFSEAPDRQWGAKVAGSPYLSGCVGELQRGRADFGGNAFSWSHSRGSAIDYLYALIEEPKVITILAPPATAQPWSLFRPLEPTIWIMTVAAMFFAGFCSYILAFFSPLSAWNLNLEFRIDDEVRFQGHLWNVVGAWMQQGQDFYPLAMSSRTVLASWWFFSIIIFSTYTADLTSYLTIANEGVRIRSIEELANQNTIFPKVVPGSSQETSLKNTPGETYQKLSSKLKYLGSQSMCTEEVIANKSYTTACIETRSVATYLMHSSCANVYRLPENIFASQMGFMVPQRAPYTDLFNFYIQKMIESGYFEKLYQSYITGAVRNRPECKVKDGGGGIELGDLSGTFIVTLFLYAAGIMFLLFEVFWSHGLKRSSLTCPGF